MSARTQTAPAIDVAIVIAAAPSRVLKAFFEAEALHAWLHVTRSLTTPRLLGPYAIEWETTDYRDEVLGPLGGVFRGTIMQFEARRSFFVADAYWLPPNGHAIGPMALEVTCTPPGTGDGRWQMDPAVATQLRVTQSGFEESVRWRRYYEIMSYVWERGLASLKSLLEQ